MSRMVELDVVLELIEDYRNSQVMSKYLSVKDCEAARNTIDGVKAMLKRELIKENK